MYTYVYVHICISNPFPLSHPLTHPPSNWITPTNFPTPPTPPSHLPHSVLSPLT